jgi:hypothetical protein
MEEETSFAGIIAKYGIWILAGIALVAALMIIMKRFGIA